MKIIDLPKSEIRQFREHKTCVWCDNITPQKSYRYCSDECCDAWYASDETTRHYLHHEKYRHRLMKNILPGIFAFDMLRKGKEIGLRGYLELVDLYYEVFKSQRNTIEDWDMFEKEFYVPAIVEGKARFFRVEGVWYMFPPVWENQLFIDIPHRRSCDIKGYLYNEFGLTWKFV